MIPLSEEAVKEIQAIVSVPDWFGYSYDRWARRHIKNLIEREREPIMHPCIGERGPVDDNRALKGERPVGQGIDGPFKAENPEASADGAQV